jgi:hypothetical protein
MPRASVDMSATDRFELKSCPGGFVVLRRMSYGEKLQRQTMATEASLRGEGKNQQMNLHMMNHRVTVFEFSHCITDHNLEDENGQKLNFSVEANVFVLDPRIGDEIANHIDDMNNFEDTDAAKNSNTGSGLQ